MKWYRKAGIDRKITFLVISLVFGAFILSSGFIYFRTYTTLNSLVEDNSKEINKQIILNYESHFNEIRDLSRYVEIETKEYETANQNTLYPLYNSLATINENVLSIHLISDNGYFVATSSSSYFPTVQMTYNEWFEKAINNDSVYFFTQQEAYDSLSGFNRGSINVSKKIFYYGDSEIQEGVLVIELNSDKIETLARQSNLGENGHIIIISDEDELIFSSTSGCIDSNCESNQVASELIIGGEFVEINDNEMYMSINTIHGTRWRIATFINVDIISQSEVSIATSLMYVFIIVTALTISLASVLAKQITKPLNQLKEHMLEIEHSDHLYKEVNIKGQKEVVILAEAYNDMIKEIRRLLDQLVNEQNEKRKTELIALQTQINPHFLYNTLDSIVWLAEQKDNEHVIEMVIALSRFFRISISRGKDIISIEKEVDHAKYYLQIQQIRYSKNFDYEFNIQEDILKLEIVKLILQPLIENAIHHGIDSNTKGLITVNAYLKEGFISFEVKNTGYGLTNDQIEEIYQKIASDNHESVGLKNVVQRLKLYYGKTSGLEVTSILDDSTTFRVYYPLQKEKN